MPGLVVESRRGGIVESVHRVSVAVVDASGRLVASGGDPDLPTFLRSAAKPFQALPLIEDGAADRFHVSEPEIALACASHNSEPAQVELVRAFLSRLELAESDLACGPHRPLAADFARLDADGAAAPIADSAAPIRNPQSAIRDGEVGGRLASNCSGKHTAMLALARHHGWPTAGYHRADHPVQRRCRETVARWSRLEAAAMREAVDGCGVVTFSLPIRALGLAYARLGSSPEPAARKIVGAMTAHPDLIAGTGRPCTALMRAYAGRILAKVGAEGVYAATLLERGLGVGLKVEDGHNWAAVVALWAVLGELGLDPAPAQSLPRFAETPVRNTRGETVGSLRAAGALSFV